MRQLAVIGFTNVALALFVLFVAPPPPARGATPAPSLANVPYGPHPNQVFDVWLVSSDKPAPFVLFIHGGGFIGGSKQELNPRELQQLLDAGISVAAVEYRFLAHAKLPAAHEDAVRALQLLRSRAKEWNLDKTRVGAFGGSAGAQLCMYLAMHDDLADPASSDPVARESTRLSCLAPGWGQVTMDMKWWRDHVPEALAGRTNHELFGTDDEDKAMKINAGISAMFLITADDPPIYMSYPNAPGQPYSADERRTRQIKIHHVVHGQTLKALCDKLGVEAHLQYPGATVAYPDAVSFLKAKLQPAR